MHLHFLLDATFRANPTYTVIELSRLNQPEQQALAGLLTGDPDVFGIFKPVVSYATVTPKVAYKDVALLFYLLQQPGRLPQFLKHVYDDDLNAMLAKLVLEEVLQLEHHGTFVCGVAASEALYGEQESNGTALTGVAALSKKAIEYVLQLDRLDFSGALSRLYSYNTVPVVAEMNTLHEMEGIEGFLGIASGSLLEETIRQYWIQSMPVEKGSWLAFHRIGTERQKRKREVTYKMYISPLLSALPSVFEKAVRLLSSTEAFSFKVGNGSRGLLRPDKFVVYFYQYGHLQQAAALLREALSIYPAQGVPFTAQLDDAGLLSWGIDPPAANVIEGLEGGSWRAHIAEKLAAAILQAKAAQLANDEAYQFVVRKMFLEKIDPFTWTPQESVIESSVLSQEY